MTAKRELLVDRVGRELREKALRGEPIMEMRCASCGEQLQVYAHPDRIDKTALAFCRCCSFRSCPLRSGGRHYGNCTCAGPVTGTPHMPACPAAPEAA